MSIPSFLRQSRSRHRQSNQNNSQALSWQLDLSANAAPSQSDLAHVKLALAFLRSAHDSLCRTKADTSMSTTKTLETLKEIT